LKDWFETKVGPLPAWSPLAVVALITLACLLPFLGKPFNMDDTLFIRAAENILKTPLDFYGFDVNWYGQFMPMYEVMKNPPLASYYIALVGGLFGFTEVALHTAFLVPAVAMSAGTYLLAARLTRYPAAATLAGVLTPVFMVSANTVMSDVMMLALWVWAILLWMKGLERGSYPVLLASGVLVALCTLTKYFGMSLIPLLAVYSILKGTRVKLWAPCLLLPVVLLAGYQFGTAEAYGRGLLFDAAGYAVNVKNKGASSLARSGLVGLVFIGGCAITPFVYAGAYWGRRAWLVVTTSALVVIVVGVLSVDPLGVSFIKSSGVDASFLLHAVVFTIAGASVMWLAMRDLLIERDADSALLFMWVVGTFAFAAFINWTTNGRSMLPAVPAAGILAVRMAAAWRPFACPALRYLPLVPALVVSLLVAYSDNALAVTTHMAARDILSRHTEASAGVWFEGHWGFQYYMEGHGGHPIDFRSSVIPAGSTIVIPLNNTNIRPVPLGPESLVERIDIHVPGIVSTMSVPGHSGFYDSGPGFLPWSLGHPDYEHFMVLRTDAPISLR